MNKKFLHILSFIVWILISIYTLFVLVVRIPLVQEKIADGLSDALESKIDAKVVIDRVDVGFLNRIIVDGLIIYDKKDKKMIRSSRLSAKIDPIDILKGKINILSAQIFGLEANFYKESANDDFNFQFVLDSLSSKDTTKTKLNVRIASLVIRNGSIRYDRKDVPEKHDFFDVNHFKISKLSSHVMLYKLTDDVLDLNVKHLSFYEKSGFILKHLGAQVNIVDNQTSIKDFVLELNDSKITILNTDFFIAKQDVNGFEKLQNYHSVLNVERLSFADIQPFVDKHISSLPVLSGKIRIDGNKDNLKTQIGLSSLKNSIGVDAMLEVENILGNISWKVQRFKLNIVQNCIAQLNALFPLPESLAGIGDANIQITSAGSKNKFDAKVVAKTSNAGNILVEGLFDNNHINAIISADGIDIKALDSNYPIGAVEASLNLDADLRKNISQSKAHLSGNIKRFTYRDQTIENVVVDANYDNQQIDGLLSIADALVKGEIKGKLNISQEKKDIDANLNVDHIYPQQLGLSNFLGNAVLAFKSKWDFTGNSVDNMIGRVSIDEFKVKGGKISDRVNDESFGIDHFEISSTKKSNIRSINIKSSVLDAELQGDYSLMSLHKSFLSLLSNKLPSLSKVNFDKHMHNNFRIYANLKQSEWMRVLLGLNIETYNDVTVQGFINDNAQQANIYATIPSANIYGYKVKEGQILFWTPDDALKSNISLFIQDDTDSKRFTELSLNTDAYDNQVLATVSWRSEGKDKFSGSVNSKTKLTHDSYGNTACIVQIIPSDIHINDSIMHMHSEGIIYSDNKLNINHLAFENATQHIYVNGTASKSLKDSVVVDLKNIDVGFILDLVDFHSVEFDGFASGRVIGHGLFDTPEAATHLDVCDFRFQEGRMGDLHIFAEWSNAQKQINIDAYADDEQGKTMTITGEVSPYREDLDLHIDAHRTNLEFLYSFCSAFLEDMNATGNGNIRVYGPFSNVNLMGDIVADGSVKVTPLNCVYTLKNDSIHFIPDDIQVNRMPIYDKFGKVAYMSGGLHHQHLTKMTYDFTIDANNFLSYDFDDFGDNTFCGTAFLTGTCILKGRSSELTIDVNGNVEDGSKFVYNASSPDAISRQEFIMWHSASDKHSDISANKAIEISNDDDVKTNIHMNFLFNVTPKSTLHLLMDSSTGDYIDLHGSGVLQATYHNKGAFNLFGNYVLDSGIYKMTIQNVMRRDFDFQKGGSITFGGDPYNASLNMQAVYTVNSVPLSDLNIGNSFSSNNIKVNCLMNITGTPEMPKVDFSMDMPTVNAEAKQMIYSIINGEEEMNQQVLYLLSVGRFYSQTENNAGMQDNRFANATTIAMQSLLSGTLSQQINNVLSSVIKNQNLNFGANISPGDEGFYNAEYEGLLDGTFFDNRLHFNGQFGYRDNATTAQQGFIGDFDIRYDLLPSGNLSVRVYNQTNDRYFTRNSLNTQGLGLILKKDFDSWKDFFVWRRKNKTIYK